MKKIIAVLAAFFILASCALSAFAVNIPKPKSNFFVNDFANVISSEDEIKMQQQGEALYKKFGAQVVVATIKSLDGASLEDYSLQMARSWGIGSKNDNNGVLLLLVLDDRKVRVEVGTGLEGALPDSKTGRILDTYGMDYFKEDNFSQGLAAVYSSLVNEVYIEYGAEPEGYTPISQDENDDEFDTADIILAIPIIVVILLATFGGRRRRRRRFFFGGFDDDDFHGGFGGGFSGGSGGGFSGGGGGFSGGGSSRGF